MSEKDGVAAPSVLQEQVTGIIQKASLAAAEFQELSQEQTDKIVERVFHAAFDARVKLAKVANAETGLGIWEHKVIKNVVASLLIYESIRREKTAGVLSHNNETGITEIAQPLGPIFAIIPVTNPTSTAIFKILIALKTRNPIIISPARKALKCTGETASICYEAALAAGAPEGCVQWLSESSRDLTHAMMAHRSIALILATGGTGLVKAAYSSGTPAIGVGPGNVPVLIDRSADLLYAVEQILLSKTFDNGTICASEQAVVVEQSIAAEIRACFEEQGGYFLSTDEVKQLERIAVVPESGLMEPSIVGQPAEQIAAKAGLAVPPGTRLLLAPLDGVGSGYPLSGEVLAPILAFYACSSLEEAMKTCIDLNYRGGVGHTAAIYANDETVIMAFGELMNAGRV